MNKEFKYHLSIPSTYIDLDKQRFFGFWQSKVYFEIQLVMGYGYPISIRSIVVLFLEISNIKFSPISIDSISHFHSHLHCRFTLAAMETEYHFGPQHPNRRIIISSCNAVVRFWLNAIISSERSS